MRHFVSVYAKRHAGSPSPFKKAETRNEDQRRYPARNSRKREFAAYPHLRLSPEQRVVKGEPEFRKHSNPRIISNRVTTIQRLGFSLIKLVSLIHSSPKPAILTMLTCGSATHAKREAVDACSDDNNPPAKQEDSLKLERSSGQRSSSILPPD